jgi:hypothetical protein
MKIVFQVLTLLISYSSFAQLDTNARGKIIVPELECQGSHILWSTYNSGDTVVVVKGLVHTDELYMLDSVVVKEVYHRKVDTTYYKVNCIGMDCSFKLQNPSELITFHKDRLHFVLMMLEIEQNERAIRQKLKEVGLKE